MRVFSKIVLIVFLSVFVMSVFAQKRIAVIGSSTAYGKCGTDCPRDSGFVAKLGRYYQNLGEIDTIYNISMAGTNCYQGMPTGYVPPAGERWAKDPDPRYNITKAVNLNPRPDVVLVCYPSNDYQNMSDEEIIFCLDSIMKYALEHGVDCYITSAQPRDDWWAYTGPDGLCRLKHVNQLILDHFGAKAIDFYTPLATSDCKIKPELAAGDFIHINNAGHDILRDLVISKNILNRVVSLEFIEFQARFQGGDVMLTWQVNADRPIDYFSVQRSSDGVDFLEVKRVAADWATFYQYADKIAGSGKKFYRIHAVEKSGDRYYSSTLSVGNTSVFFAQNIRLAGNELIADIQSDADRSCNFELYNMNGQVVFRERKSMKSGRYQKNVSFLSPGTYVLVIRAGGSVVRQTLVKR